MVVVDCRRSPAAGFGGSYQHPQIRPTTTHRREKEHERDTGGRRRGLPAGKITNQSPENTPTPRRKDSAVAGSVFFIHEHNTNLTGACVLIAVPLGSKNSSRKDGEKKKRGGEGEAWLSRSSSVEHPLNYSSTLGTHELRSGLSFCDILKRKDGLSYWDGGMEDDGGRWQMVVVSSIRVVANGGRKLLIAVADGSGRWWWFPTLLPYVLEDTFHKKCLHQLYECTESSKILLVHVLVSPNIFPQQILMLETVVEVAEQLGGFLWSTKVNFCKLSKPPQLQMQCFLLLYHNQATIQAIGIFWLPPPRYKERENKT
ncbi:hypothetical protein LXL04_007586 [Taraxacum kok-saghyz]